LTKTLIETLDLS